MRTEGISGWATATLTDAPTVKCSPLKRISARIASTMRTDDPEGAARLRRAAARTSSRRANSARFASPVNGSCDAAQIAGDSFFALFSDEELELLDLDTVVWIVGDDLALDAILDLPLRDSLAFATEGREVFADFELSGAFSFSSPLSIPYLLDARHRRRCRRRRPRGGRARRRPGGGSPRRRDGVRFGD